MDNTQRFYDLEKIIKERVPGFKIKFKDESTLMKVVGKVLFFNKSFMTSYTTTIGKTVYFPSRVKFEKNPGAYFYTLAHEYVHVMDYVAHPVRFTLGYAFPQFLAAFSLLSLLAFINPYFLLFLFALAFAAPIPAPYRTWAELRGYGMSLLVRSWDGWASEEVANMVNRYADAFTTSAYYFMCPFRTYVLNKLLDWLLSGETHLSDVNPAFMDVYALIKHEDL